MESSMTSEDKELCIHILKRDLQNKELNEAVMYQDNNLADVLAIIEREPILDTCSSCYTFVDCSASPYIFNQEDNTGYCSHYKQICITCNGSGYVRKHIGFECDVDTCPVCDGGGYNES